MIKVGATNKRTQNQTILILTGEDIDHDYRSWGILISSKGIKKPGKNNETCLSRSTGGGAGLENKGVDWK